MPTQFNTKDSGRRTESLTAMTTHALQNDRFISARTHRKQPHKPAPDDTAVSVWDIKPADIQTQTQTKPLDKHFAFPERLFCPLQEAAAATFSPNRFVYERLVEQNAPHLPACLGVEELTCPVAYWQIMERNEMW